MTTFPNTVINIITTIIIGINSSITVNIIIGCIFPFIKFALPITKVSIITNIRVNIIVIFIITITTIYIITATKFAITITTVSIITVININTTDIMKSIIIITITSATIRASCRSTLFSPFQLTLCSEKFFQNSFFCLPSCSEKMRWGQG